MKALRALLLMGFAVSILLASTACSATITTVSSKSHMEYVPGEVIVKFKSNVNIRDALGSEYGVILKEEYAGALKVTSAPSVNALLKKHKAKEIGKYFKGIGAQARIPGDLQTIKRKYPLRARRAQIGAKIPDLSRVFKIKVPEDEEISSIIQEYKNDPNVEYAEPNYRVNKLTIPNDPYFSSFGSWGQSYSDLWGLKLISAEAAWDINTGSSNIVIAVIDTGLDYNHEDIAAHVWANSAEIPSNGVDDDGNGYIDDVKGWDFINNDNDPIDDNGHGTYVTGAIASVGNNNVGIVGVTWASKIMSLKSLDSYGNGSNEKVAEAIIYAADNGADIINLGLGGSDFSQVLKDSVDYAYGLGCILIGAAGNSNSNTVSYPACFDKVISVAATDHNDNKAIYSNWGTKIDIAAPGGDDLSGAGCNVLSLKSTILNSSYQSYVISVNYLRVAGTSMAASHVSGLAALILSNFSGLSQKGVKQILCSTADDLGDPGWDQYFGNGRINAQKALLKSSEMKANGVIGYISLPVEGEFVQGNIEIKGQAFGSKFQSYTLEYGVGVSPSSWVELASSNTPLNYGAFCTWNTTSVSNGIYKLRLRIVANDAGIFEDTVLINVVNPVVSIRSGRWSDASTWRTGTVPTSIEPVVISSGHEVLFDRNSTSTTCRKIKIESTGTLLFDTGPQSMQVKGDIDIYGRLELVSGSILKIECETYGQYGINVYSGGELRGKGSVPTVVAMLSAPIGVAGQTITVTSTSGIGVGDIITIGEGANAEGFTITAISGNQITLNRKAVNAQIPGAEVYKNATVTSSSISVGTRTFAVSALGGIRAGDRILITKNPSSYDADEIFDIESVDMGSNSITVSGAFGYAHPNNVMAIKLNRDTKITRSYPYDSRNYYLVVYPGAKLNMEGVEVERVVGKTGENIYGFTIKSSENCSISRSSLHHGNFGVLLETGSSGVDLVSNVVYRNNGGIVFRSRSEKTNVMSNIICLNYGGGIEIENGGIGGTGKDYIFFNTIFSNQNGLYYLGANLPNLSLFNNVFSNYNYNLSYGSNIIVAHNDFKYGWGGGVYLAGSNNIYLGNAIENNNNAGIYNSHNERNNIFAYCSIINNSRSDILLSERTSSLGDMDLIIKNPTLRNVMAGHDKGYMLIQKPNGESGVSKIYGNYHVPSTSTQQINYIDQSYPSSSTNPILFRGSSHTISAIETNDGTTTTEVWFVTYRSATFNWEVKGTVSDLQTNRATSGVAYTSDAGQVNFTLTQTAGVQEGDQFVFATIAAAGDVNTQKKILFGQSAIPELNNQSRLTVDPGGKVELKGTADYPTLIDYDGTGDYGFVISGEVDAQYFDFNQINAEGIKIDPTATITRFDNGAIRNVKGAGPHLSINGKDHTFNYVNFDNTGAYDVKAQNDADLIFARSQRGAFNDQVLDTSSVTWDDPVIGYIQPGIIGTLSYNSSTKVLTIPFKIKDPNSSACMYKANSFQYSTNGGLTWNSVLDSDLSGIGSPFASSTNYGSAPEQIIYWNTGANYANLEANLAVRFRVNNGFIYGNYGSSEAIPFNLVPPIVQVLSPNGGEVYKGGGSTTIHWSAVDEGSGIADNSIALYYNIGAGDVLIDDNLPNTGSYAWTTPAITTSEARVKTTARDNVGQTGQDISDTAFSIDSTPPNPPTINISTIKTPTLINYQTIGGSRTTDSANIVVNGSSERVGLPTSTTWTAQVTLIKGRNNVAIKAVDSVGNESSPEVVVIEGADRIFTDSVSGASVTIPFGAPTIEVESVNFDRIDLLIPPPRGANSTGKAFKITSIVDAFSLPVEIILPKPAGISNLRCYAWSSANNKWNRNSIKAEDENNFTFDSNTLGTYAIFEIVDFNPPNIGGIKIGGRLVSAGDSIKSTPVLTVNISDDYGVDVSSNLLSVDGGADKSLNANQAQSAGISVTGSYAFSETEKLSLGYHKFKIMAADEVGNTASCEATLFVVGDSIPGLLIYPNPYKLGTANGVKFDGLTEDIRVRIYDIAGDLVWTGQNTPGSASLTWSAVNSSGAQVVPGVYLYVVTTNSGGKASGKIAVIR